MIRRGTRPRVPGIFIVCHPERSAPKHCHPERRLCVAKDLPPSTPDQKCLLKEADRYDTLLAIFREQSLIEVGGGKETYLRDPTKYQTPPESTGSDKSITALDSILSDHLISINFLVL